MLSSSSSSSDATRNDPSEMDFGIELPYNTTCLNDGDDFDHTNDEENHGQVHYPSIYVTNCSSELSEQLQADMRRAQRRRWLRQAITVGLVVTLTTCLLPAHQQESIRSIVAERWNNNNDERTTSSSLQDDEDSMMMASLFSPIQDARYYPPWKTTTTASSSHAVRSNHGHDTSGVVDTAVSGPINPTVYGWTPEPYPNPLKNPLRCGISFLSSSDEPPIRLCDPDWMLGGIVLTDVAAAMQNFTETFGMKNNGSSTMDDSSNTTTNARVLLRRRLMMQPVTLAIAAVSKMNIAAVLRQASYYTYEEDEDDMVSDAAQIFARQLHENWAVGDFGILLFLSVQDRICFISTGSGLTEVLPWWRLDQIVNSMKPDLRHRDYGNAILEAIQDLTIMLTAGPPSWADRFYDFVGRFGVVIAFALLTFLFGAWGEYRDRRKRWQYAEQRSKLSGIDREKALQLQKDFRARACPICLESFNYGKQQQDAAEPEKETSTAPEPTSESTLDSLLRLSSDVDRFGVPKLGADGRKVKLLRCGHIFCETCWKCWVHSGCGNPCNCPVCRQDVGRPPQKLSTTTLLSESTPLMSRRPTRRGVRSSFL